MTIVSSEPLFHGVDEGKPLVGLGAEEFFDRVSTHVLTNNLIGQQAASFAIQKLRDLAHAWFHEELPSLQGDLQILARVDLAVFWALFRARYFKINTIKDISTEWATLVREDGEKPSLYFRRTIRAMHRLNPLLPTAIVDVPMMDTVNTAIGDLLTVFQAQNGARDHVAVVLARNVLDAAIRNSHINVSTRQKKVDTDNITLKVLAAGMNNHKMREIIRKEEMNYVSTQHALEAIEDAEKEFPLAHWKRANGKGQYEVTQNGGEKQSETKDSDEQNRIDAIAKKKKENKRNKKQQQQQQHPVSEDKKEDKAGPWKMWDRSNPVPPPEVGPCRYCGQKGHWNKNCPKNQKPGHVRSVVDPAPQTSSSDTRQERLWFVQEQDERRNYNNQQWPKNY